MPIMNPPALQEQDGQLPELRRKRELSSDDRKRVVSRLLLSLKDEGPLPKLKHGAITEAANFFHAHCVTITNIWCRGQANFANPHVKMFKASPRKKNCGRKQKWDRDAIREAIPLIPLYQRTTFRDLSLALKIPKSTLFDMKNEREDMVIMPVTLALKPLLSEEHKL